MEIIILVVFLIICQQQIFLTVGQPLEADLDLVVEEEDQIHIPSEIEIASSEDAAEIEIEDEGQSQHISNVPNEGGSFPEIDELIVAEAENTEEHLAAHLYTSEEELDDSIDAHEEEGSENEFPGIDERIAFEAENTEEHVASNLYTDDGVFTEDDLSDEQIVVDLVKSVLIEEEEEEQQQDDGGAEQEEELGQVVEQPEQEQEEEEEGADLIFWPFFERPQQQQQTEESSSDEDGSGSGAFPFADFFYDDGLFSDIHKSLVSLLNDVVSVRQQRESPEQPQQPQQPPQQQLKPVFFKESQRDFVTQQLLGMRNLLSQVANVVARGSSLWNANQRQATYVLYSRVTEQAVEQLEAIYQHDAAVMFLEVLKESKRQSSLVSATWVLRRNLDQFVNDIRKSPDFAPLFRDFQDQKSQERQQLLQQQLLQQSRQRQAQFLQQQLQQQQQPQELIEEQDQEEHRTEDSPGCLRKVHRHWQTPTGLQVDQTLLQSTPCKNDAMLYQQQQRQQLQEEVEEEDSQSFSSSSSLSTTTQEDELQRRFVVFFVPGQGPQKLYEWNSKDEEDEPKDMDDEKNDENEVIVEISNNEEEEESTPGSGEEGGKYASSMLHYYYRQHGETHGDLFVWGLAALFIGAVLFCVCGANGHRQERDIESGRCDSCKRALVDDSAIASGTGSIVDLREKMAYGGGGNWGTFNIAAPHPPDTNQPLLAENYNQQIMEI